MTQERLEEICQQTGKTETKIWDLYVDKRIDYRPTKGEEKSIELAITETADELKIEHAESLRLYAFLHDKMLG